MNSSSVPLGVMKARGGGQVEEPVDRCLAPLAALECRVIALSRSQLLLLGEGSSLRPAKRRLQMTFSTTKPNKLNALREINLFTLVISDLSK